jgi:hypothetical protein
MARKRFGDEGITRGERAALSQCHDLVRQARPSRALAFVRSERPHGRCVSWQTPAAAA